MLVTRRELRIAFLAGLGNAFGAISGVAFGYYVPLAVFACSGGTYGASWELGRQRLLGTILGGLLLYIAFWGLGDIHLSLALAITLGALRLLGGLFRLKVGYKVGGLIIVMGWLIHSSDMGMWISLRLFWTAFGVLITMLGLQLFWPMRSSEQVFSSLAAILDELQQGVEQALTPLENTSPGRPSAKALQQAARNRILQLRKELPNVGRELGENPSRHPRYRLIILLIQAGSRLTTAICGLLRQPPVRPDLASLKPIHNAEREVLVAIGSRLKLWHSILLQPRRQGQLLPPPPQDRFTPPQSWRLIYRELDNDDLQSLELIQLERVAGRMQRCRQACRALMETEQQWAELAGS
ncbi:MAG: FUSC family protein [Synechococcus sp. MED-G71]|nr:MAG: FUSC family protein [Synechococcus sp. MED-G71]